jgi:hypothetical protein
MYVASKRSHGRKEVRLRRRGWKNKKVELLLVGGDGRLKVVICTRHVMM